MPEATQHPGHNHLSQVKLLWQLEGDIRFVRRVENFVYESKIAGRPVILRLTEPKHRSADEIFAELAWMDYLAKSGMRVAAPIESNHGHFVETVQVNEIYHACVFEKAPGAPLNEREEFSAATLDTWGRYVGQMHRLTKKYRPAPTAPKRKPWNNDTSLAVSMRGLDVSDSLAYNRFHELMNWLLTLEQDCESYGLVHCDMHQGNFFVHQGEITAFDFDDSCYHWFAYDLISPLYPLLGYSHDLGLNFTREGLLEPYLRGYLAENALDEKWLARLDLFFKVRVVMVYHWIKASMVEGVFNEKGLEWCRRRLPWSLNLLREPLSFK